MRYRGQLVAVLGVCVAGLGGFAACVGDDSQGNPDATTDGAADGTTQDVKTTDVVNDVPIDAPTGCAARTADDTGGVFVAKSGSDVNSCGTRSNPCLTITYAIATGKATTGKTTIYVAAAPPEVSDAGDAGDAGAAPGEYDESLTLDAPLTIEGGWSDVGGTWSPICDATTSTAVVIRGVTSTTIDASFTGSATLRDLAVKSKTAASPGESIYGIFASGSGTKLTLDQVVVDVAPGGAGVDGTNGTNGTNATTSGCTPGTGQAGTAGSNATGATAGTFTPTGYVAGNGGDGGSGNAGSNGTAGGQGSCLSTCSACQSHTPTSSQCTFLSNQTDCAQNGQSGCAGAGGVGGGYATSGGSSVAVYVWDAHVTVFGGSFKTSNGGNGGNGGLGGDGGTPTNGVAGNGGGCPNADFSCSGGSCLLGTVTPLSGGNAGGKGGAGGAGAQGGGGAGGFSYDFVSGGDGGVALNGNPNLAFGDGGTGGAFGGANGASGDKWP